MLHAYSATNLATEYWNSSQAASNRDQGIRFSGFTHRLERLEMHARESADHFKMAEFLRSYIPSTNLSDRDRRN